MDSSIIEASNVLQNLQSAYTGVPMHHPTPRHPPVTDASVVVKSPDHAVTMLDTFYRMYQQHIGCDFIIAVESSLDGTTSEFLVHKLVLNGASKFFKGIFDYHHGNRQVLSGIRLADVSNIIEFMYTGALRLDKNNVWGMWTVASYLQVPDAMRLCEEFSRGSRVIVQDQPLVDKDLSRVVVDENVANMQPVFNVPISARKTGTSEDIRLGRIISNQPERQAQATQLQEAFQTASMQACVANVNPPPLPTAPAMSLQEPPIENHNKGLDLLALSASVLHTTATVGNIMDKPATESFSSAEPVPSSSQQTEQPDTAKVEDGYLSSGSAMDVSDFEESGYDNEQDLEVPSKSVSSESKTESRGITQNLKVTLRRCSVKKEYTNPEIADNPLKKYECQFCNRKFCHLSTLSHHLRLKHVCWPTTHSSYKLYQVLRGAVKVSSDAGVSCSRCNQGFRYYTQLKTHFVQSHSSLNKCHMCGKKCISATQLRLHKLKEHRKLLSDTQTCHLCPRVFLYKSTLQKHSKSAHRAKQRKKQVPLKIKVKKSTPKLRKSQSKQEKKAFCPKCDKQYSRVSSLKEHLKTKHGMTTRQIQSTIAQPEMKTRNAQTFKCFKCDKTYNKVLHIKAHLYKHHGVVKGTATRLLQESGVLPDASIIDFDNLICCECNKTFERKKHLHNHAQFVHGLKLPNRSTNSRLHSQLVKCEIAECSFQTSQIRQMKQHMQEVHPLLLQSHHCPQCAFKCATRMELDRHMKRGHDKRSQAVCDLCGKCFKKQYYLRIHKFNAHRIHDETMKIYECEYVNCKYQSTSKHALNMHKARHNKEKPFTCDYCGRKVKTKKNLEKHINKVHMNIRPFMCHLCGMAYGEDSELKNHITRQHIGVKPFQCEHCPYKSVDKHALRGHLFAVHRVKVSEDQEIFKCEYCDYMCDRKARLQKHMKAHLGIRDEVCPHCGKAFSHHHSLVNHIKWIHTAKTLRCDYCDYMTVDTWKLSQHIRVMHTHRGLKPYKCPYCDFHSATGGNCRKHVMNKHKGMKVGWIKVAEVPNPENPSTTSLPESASLFPTQ